MKQFLDKILGYLIDFKLPFITIIFLVVAYLMIYNIFIGGQDKRGAITTIISLVLMAAFMFYLEHIVLWIKGL